jgi:molybdopterin converting factor small subunit
MLSIYNTRMATIHIPTQMRDLTAGVDTFPTSADSVGRAIAEIESRFAGLAARLLVDGELAPGIQVSVDGVMTSRGVRAKLTPTSEVFFLPAMVGG